MFADSAAMVAGAAFGRATWSRRRVFGWKQTFGRRRLGHEGHDPAVHTEEAHYVAAFLNSDHVAKTIAAWMTRGLFGARHVHKRALDVAWPTFDPDDETHGELASVAMELAGRAQEASRAASGRRTAQMRDSVRQALSLLSLDRVEVLVTTISGRRPYS